MTIGFAFLHPALLWALPVAAVPIIIHLLNRRRFARVRWAAMEYLLAALKRNRRRLRMEQWLVLLLRVLAVVLLVFLVSRPQLTGAVLGEVRTLHVVCLDDSASMAHRQGAVATFDAAIDRIQNLADKLADTRPRDLLTVLRASRARTPDLAAFSIGPRLKARVRELLGEFTVQDGVADLATLLEQARLRIGESAETGRAEIHLFTDLRTCDWLTEEGQVKPELLRAVMALDPQRQRLTVVSVSPADEENLAIVDVRREGRIAAVGVPIGFTVEVVNQGRQPSASAELAFEVEGTSRVLRPVGSLQPGEGAEVTFTHTFHAPGFHGVTASLPRDRYAIDDSRALALEVVETSRVLLVDGDPGERPEEAETFFLALALAHRESGIGVEVIPDHALADRDLAEIDMVYLCNVPTPDAGTLDKLGRFVRGGGGLAIFLGNQVDPARYNQLLWADGNGLLPAALGELAGDLDRPQPIHLADPTHAMMARSTEGLALAFSTLVSVGRYFEVAVDPKHPPAIVLRVRDGEGPPLLLARSTEGGGEVILVTTTADEHWTDLPRRFPYLIVTQQMHAVASRVHADNAYNLGPAGLLQLELDPGKYRPDVVARPIANGGVDSTFTARTRSGVEDAAAIESTVSVPMAELEGLGLFTLWLTPHAGDKERRLLARNAPPIEGELHKLGSRALLTALPEEARSRVTVVEAEGDQRELTAGQGELWRLLALAMLAALLLESVLAWRFGRR